MAARADAQEQHAELLRALRAALRRRPVWPPAALQEALGTADEGRSPVDDLLPKLCYKFKNGEGCLVAGCFARMQVAWEASVCLMPSVRYDQTSSGWRCLSCLRLPMLTESLSALAVPALSLTLHPTTLAS